MHPADPAQHRCLIHDTQPNWILIGGEQLTLRPLAAPSPDSMGFLLKSVILGGVIALLSAYVYRAARARGHWTSKTVLGHTSGSVKSNLHHGRQP